MALFLHKEAPFNGDLFLGRSLNPPFRGDGQKHPPSFFVCGNFSTIDFKDAHTTHKSITMRSWDDGKETYNYSAE